MAGLLEQLVMEIQNKHTTPVGVHNNPNVHGPNSLFGVPGLERDVISTRVAGSGLASVLPVRGNTKMYPLFPYITGKAAPVGSQDGDACTDAPSAGAFKTCFQTAQFGLYKFKTRELNITTVGALVNAGEETDLRWVNDPLAAQMGRLFMPMASAAMALEVGREMLARMVEVGLDFQELLSRKIYTGTGTGADFPGLEKIVVTDHYDAKTNLLCESLASDVRDFGDVDITTSAGAAAIVAQLVDMYRNLNHRAEDSRMNPVRFAFVMRPQLFRYVADVWPCAFMTSGCVTASQAAPVIVNSDEQIRMRVDMQTRKYLQIDGDQVPVITDSWMAETDLGSSQFSSDVYLLPFTVRGGREVLFWEVFDYNAGVNQTIQDAHLAPMFWTDGGRYLHTVEYTKACLEVQTTIQPRIRLEVPHLAGRLMNVAMTLTGSHDIDPGSDGSSLYQQNTGNSYVIPDTLYANSWA